MLANSSAQAHVPSVVPTPYAPIGGAFLPNHERFTYEEASFDWEALRASIPDERIREQGRRSFVLRALDEQRSMLAFSELLKELCETRAPVDVISAVTRIVRDEALHVDLCGRVVEACGGWPEGAPSPNWVKSDPRLTPRARILHTMVGSLCVGETISVAMIAGVRKYTTNSIVHSILTRMLADESFHSRVGFWWLERTELSSQEIAQMHIFLRRVFAGVERSARPSPEVLAANRFSAHAFGAMPPREREEAFLQAIHETIVPSLERAGIPARQAWDERH